MTKKLLISIITLFLTSCDFGQKFNTEFENFVSTADSVHNDGDLLHPTNTYFKNGRIIGIEFDENPSCGKHNRKYFISNNGKIEKIIIRKDFYTGDCEKFDSLYVIEPETNSIKVYTNGTKGKQIENKRLIQENLIDIEKHKLKIKTAGNKGYT